MSWPTALFNLSTIPAGPCTCCGDPKAWPFLYHSSSTCDRVCNRCSAMAKDANRSFNKRSTAYYANQMSNTHWWYQRPRDV